MKKLSLPLWFTVLTAFFVFTSCDQPRDLTDEEFSERLTEIKQEMQVASYLLEEAISADNSKELIANGDGAINAIEDQLNAYMNTMDEVARKIPGDARSNIIAIKQKVVETDFRLALLENNEQFRISEQVADYDEIPEARRTRPVNYRFPPIPAINGGHITEMVEYGAEVMEEARTNLQELKVKLNLFIEDNL